MDTTNTKLEAAIAYLRSRNRYIMDRKCAFTPTRAVMTDITETIRQYRLEVEKQPAVKLVKKK